MVRALTEGLDETLAKAGLPTGKFGLRGSAVTEHKFDKASGKYSGQRTTVPSDYDIAIVSSELLKIAKKKGLTVLRSGKRTTPLRRKDLGALGIRNPIRQLSNDLGVPELSVMIYRDDDSLISRGAMMWLKE